MPQNVGWKIADDVLSARQQFEATYGIKELVEWSKCTETYFHSLKARRETMIVWANASKPHIIFVGQTHYDAVNGSTNERMHEIDDIQTRIFETLRRYVPKVQVIAMEAMGGGSHEVITQSVYVCMVKQILRSQEGHDLNDRQILESMKKDRQASTRAILELPGTPVICGEEWPNHLQLSLMKRRSKSLAERLSTDGLINLFTTLRSEIMLIRTLEFLHHRNGSAGIMLQGERHREDIEMLAPKYQVTLTTESPE